MLTANPIPNEAIARCLLEDYGVSAADIIFVPRGADPQAAAYRVADTAGRVFFLKLRAAPARGTGVGIAHFLHTNLRLSSVLAPMRALDGRLTVSRDHCEWLLFPFVAGQDGFARALSPAQWRQLGETVARLHGACLPAQWRDALPRESFAMDRRDEVRRIHADVLHGRLKGDAIVGDFAALWHAQRDAIALAIRWTEALGDRARARTLPLVPCHADLHAGNVIVGDDGAISIVDWDTMVMAPRERDCMFIGAGVGGAWNSPEERRWFFEGYGDTALCEEAVGYYRFARILTDLAEFADILCEGHAGDADRRLAVQWMEEMFAPGNVFACALRGAPELRCPG